MRYQDIVIDAEYAVRANVGAQQAVVHVLVVAKTDETKQVTVRHLEPPLAGVEETIGFRRVVASWQDHNLSLYEEGRVGRLRELSAHADHIMMNAVQLVFDSSGESVSVEIDAHVKSYLGPLMRLADRAGFEQSLDAIDPEAFVDHRGDVHFSYSAAERLAIRFAQNEPELVLLEIGSWEGTVLARRGRPGTPFHGFVLEQEAVHALARKWAGAPTRLNELEAENGRLRELLTTACRELELAGKEAVAAKLAVGLHIV